MTGRMWWSAMAVVAAGSVAIAAQAPGEVTLTRLGNNRVRVAGTIVVHQPLEVVWRVLTDYDRLSDFIPGLLESRTLAVTPTRILQQQGVTRWWLFSRTVRITFQVDEQPMHAIRFAAIDGDFREHQGAWQVALLDGHVRVTYEATIRPRFVLPPLLGARLLKRQLRESLQAIAERAGEVQASTAATTP